MSYNKLSADPSALILGICSIVIGIAGCCCYGVLAIIPLVLGIIGLVMANKSIREYNTNPEVFSPQSRSNVGIGRVLNIIGIVLNGIIVLIFVVVLALYGSIFSAAMLQEMENGGFDTNTETYDYEDDIETTEDDDTYEVEEGDFQEEDTTEDSELKDSIN